MVHEAEITKEQDPMYSEAVNIVHETKRTSISYIQRRLRIGYNRAARLLEAMEYDGIIGSMNSRGERPYIDPGSVEKS